MKLPESYAGMGKAISRYWADYGGWSDFVRSPLFHLSVLIAAGSYNIWTKEHWTDLPLSLLPNLLGFSLGAYALIFSLAGEKLLAALNVEPPDGRPTLLRIINATFLHFILVQTFAIIFALMSRATIVTDAVGLIPIDSIAITKIQCLMTKTAGAFGYWLTIYAVVLLIGAAIAAYRLAIMSGRAASISQSTPTG